MYALTLVNSANDHHTSAKLVRCGTNEDASCNTVTKAEAKLLVTTVEIVSGAFETDRIHPLFTSIDKLREMNNKTTGQQWHILRPITKFLTNFCKQLKIENTVLNLVFKSFS